MVCRKKALDYVFIALYVMCIFFALSAALEDMTIATERPYLRQGKILLSCCAILLCTFLLMRAQGSLARKISGKTAAWLGRIWFVAVLASGVYLRLQVINAIPLSPSSDFETYYKLGDLLAKGDLLKDSYRQLRDYVAMFPHTIGFPLLVLKPAFSWFGTSVPVALYTNVAFSAASAALMYGIGHKTAGRMAGLIAMTLMSLWPSHVLYASMVASEPAFTCLLLLSMYLVLIGIRRGPGSLYEKNAAWCIAALLAAGIAMGMANAVRPMAVVLVAAVVLFIFMSDRHRRPPIHSGAAKQIMSIRSLVLALILLPFLLTNIILTNRVTDAIRLEPASGITASGYNLLVGTNVENKGLWNQENADYFNDIYMQTGSATQAHLACMTQAIEYIRANPENVLDLMVYKFRDLWQTDDFGIDWNLLWAGQQELLTPLLSNQLEDLRPIGRMAYFCLLALCAVGAFQALLRQRFRSPLRILALFFLGTAALHMALETQVRYHYSAIAFLILAAAITLATWRQDSQAEQPALQLHVDGNQKEEIATQAPKGPAVQNTAPDIASAIQEGHIVITMSKRSAQEALNVVGAEEKQDA